LAEEVLQRQPPQIQSFLLQTSVLDRLCGPLCDLVLGTEAAAPGGPASSQEILDRMEHANLFLIPLDDDQRWYRYHQLFADLLRHRLQQTDPNLAPALCRRASRWHEQNGLLADAIAYALAGQDHERALALVEQAAGPALMHSEVATFLGWLDRLPGEMVQTRPALCIYHAWARLINGDSLETVEALLPAAPTAGAESELAAPLRAFIALFRGDMGQAVSLSRQALAQLAETEPFLRGLAALTLGLAYLTDGNVAASGPALDQATQISQKTGNVMVAVVVLCSLGEQCRKQGQLHQAYRLFQQALERATDDQGRRWPVAGRALISLGDLLREWDDLEPAERLLLEGIELANRWGQVWALSGYLALARLWQAQGKPGEALKAMRQAGQRVRQNNFSLLSQPGVEMLEAWLAVIQGDLAAVRRWATHRGAAEAIDPSELDERQDFAKYHLRKYEYPVLARLWLAEGRAAETLALLDRAEPRVEKQQRPGLVIEYNLLKAQALHSLGRGAEALQALERALTLAEPEGYVRLIVDEGEPIRRLLLDFRSALEGRNPRLKAYVDKLLPAFAEAAPAKPESPVVKPPLPQTPAMAEALSTRELEVLRLLATSLSAAEIADELSVAVSTVRSHTKSIYAKLGVSGRLEALQRARELGWL
ncbi:MAG TPA: tetratricopeptide repeat protein, partial [Rhodocyclaceae bacterium]|nr:tetratricopeptide repeat protein [Rhodocyclaceae bacterium]